MCACHGLAQGWAKDKRRKGGGRWECRVKRQEYNRRRSAQRVAWAAAKLERDPLTRCRARITNAARKRRYRKTAQAGVTVNPRMAEFLTAVRQRGG